MSTLITIRVVSPRGELIKKEVRSVTSKNSAGKFDVLPQHANFVTLIENEPIYIIDQEGKQTKLEFKLAIMHCYSNRINVFTDIEASELNEEIVE